METIELRNNLTASLAQIYDIKAFSSLAEFLQGELHVLHHLSQNSDIEMNPSILSDHLHVSRSRMTAALSTLRKKGYIKMEMSENDRRRMRVIITANGEAYINEKREKVERYFDVLIEGLGEQKVNELIGLIELSVKIMNNKETQL